MRASRASCARTSWTLLAVCLTAVAVGTAQTGQTTRDAVRPAALTGHGTLAGVVISDQTPGSPIARATISVSLADGQPLATAYTDARGQFEVSNLPAGRYVLVATKPAYVRAPYGARRYDRPATPITLADGQTLGDLKFVMARGAVITGVVTDGGQPAPGLTVRALQIRTVGGVRALEPVTQGGGPALDVTDDHGTYRIFGLPAGDYIVSVSPRPMAAGEIRQMTPADIQSVREAMQALTAAQTSPAARPPNPVTVTYATVYYPDTTVAANARPVTVSAGEERGSIDLAMQLVHTARIDGIVLTPSGVPPQSVSLLLVPSSSDSNLTALGPMMIALSRVTPGPDGRFTYIGIAPGTYTLSARATVQGGNGADANAPAGRGLPPAPSVRPGAQGPMLWGQTDVSVNGENVSGVSVTLQPGMTISGRVSAGDGPNAPNLALTRLSLAPASIAGGLMIGVPTPTVDATGHFTFAGIVPGRYRLSAALADRGTTWIAKSAMIKGHDALDVPFDVAPNENITDGEVTFTDQTQDVSGHLVDASGRPATDFTIVLFPADRTSWTSARRVRTAQPATDGRFDFANVPAGDYRLAAVADVAPGETSDPAFLEQVAPASIALTLHDGERKVQDVRLTGGG